ncbi:putative mitochondrial protein [Tanacetum coccineum]
MKESTLKVLQNRQNSLLPTPKAPYTSSYANRSMTYPPKATTTTLALPAPQTSGTNSAYVQPRKQLTQKEITDKRAKNLCFYCDEKFVPGHKCSGQLFSLEICADVSNSEVCELEELLEEPVMHNFQETMVDTPVISLDALTGKSTYKTMRVKAYVGKHTVHSLIDSGSTHTFLDFRVAKKLGCKLKATCPIEVSVANGQIMNSSYECKGFKWNLQGVEFTSDVLILPLGGCEMVLGVQWSSILGDIRWNFRNLVLDFVYNNKRMVLRGTHKAALQWMSGKRHTKAAKSSQADQGQLLCVYLNTLQQDHIIPLLPNTLPINILPYKYPPNQKDAVEAMVTELIESGVIRDSQSPYSSLIILVKKKDGIWRMCVDYRQLNKYTVKDKFPIPLVEELLDELHGAHFFSKLDLRSRYHQIRMHEDDIGKTAFRTHEGHYEFLVMPFSLTNAPSTFQSLMNTHLQLVMQVMKQNSLYAKMSKCTFATTQVEYLGHIISGKGVSTDPSKITAMKKWPTLVNVKQLRGFLGLTGYYRRFQQNYAIISKPLTTLPKKHSFTWNPDAQLALEYLKTAMSQALVLALPDFNNPFTVETDASGLEIGAVLQQGRDIQ